MLYNQIRFDMSFLKEDSIKKESRVEWVQINTQVRQTYPYQITQTHLFLQDDAVNLDDLTEFSDPTVFNFEGLPIRSYEKNDFNVRMEITVEMNLDMIEI